MRRLQPSSPGTGHGRPRALPLRVLLLLGGSVAGFGIPSFPGAQAASAQDFAALMRAGEGIPARWEATVGGDFTARLSGTARLYPLDEVTGQCRIVVHFRDDTNQLHQTPSTIMALAGGMFLDGWFPAHPLGPPVRLDIGAFETPAAQPGRGSLFFETRRVDGGSVDYRARAGAFQMVQGPDGLEAVFDVDLEEPTPRVTPQGATVPRFTASMQGRITDIGLETAGGGWGSGPCLPADELRVTETRPSPERENVLLDFPPIYVTFSEPVMAITLRDNLTLRTWSHRDGEREVRGSVSLESDTVALFEPDEELLSGVIYEATVRGGADGVQGRSGAALVDDHVWRFSTVLDLAARAPSGEDPITVDLVQTVRNATLVQGKVTLNRVGVNWEAHDDIDPDWQPTDFRMEVRPSHAFLAAQDQFGMRRPSYSASLYGLKVRRPDQLSQADTLHARNTVNFFGWQPAQTGGSSLEVEVEITPFEPYPEEFENLPPVIGTRDVGIETRDPVFVRLFYTPLRVAAWADSIPAADYAHMRNMMEFSSTLASQILPIGGASTFLALWSSQWLRNQERWQLDLIGRAPLPLLRTVAQRVHDAMASVASNPQDFAVILHPDDFRYKGRALSEEMPGYRNRTVSMYVDPGDPPAALSMGLVHEMGHTYGLRHVPQEGDGGCGHLPRGRYREIDGFRLSEDGVTGWNKSGEHGNAEAPDLLPIMWPCVEREEEIWIYSDHYEQARVHLQRGLALHLPRGSALSPVHGPGGGAWPMATQATDPLQRILVTGSLRTGDGIDADGGWIETVTHIQREWDSAPGPFTADLLGADGTVLASTDFGVESFSAETLEWLEAEDVDLDDSIWWPYFSVALPYVETARSLVIREGDRILAERERATSPPSLLVGGNAMDGLEVDGEVTLRWTTDGEIPATVTVLYAASGPGAAPGAGPEPTGSMAEPVSWEILTYQTGDTSLTLRSEELEPGLSPRLRLVANDGFNETVVDLPVTLRREVLPVTLSPGPTEIEDLLPAVSAQFETDLSGATLTDRFELLDENYRSVEGEVAYVAGSRIAVFLPAEELEAGRGYTALLSPGIEDLYGNRLEREVEWSFRVPDDLQGFEIPSPFEGLD